MEVGGGGEPSRTLLILPWGATLKGSKRLEGGGGQPDTLGGRSWEAKGPPPGEGMARVRRGRHRWRRTICRNSAPHTYPPGTPFASGLGLLPSLTYCASAPPSATATSPARTPAAAARRPWAGPRTHPAAGAALPHASSRKTRLETPAGCCFPLHKGNPGCGPHPERHGSAQPLSLHRGHSPGHRSHPRSLTTPRTPLCPRHSQPLSFCSAPVSSPTCSSPPSNLSSPDTTPHPWFPPSRLR